VKKVVLIVLALILSISCASCSAGKKICNEEMKLLVKEIRAEKTVKSIGCSFARGSIIFIINIANKCTKEEIEQIAGQIKEFMTFERIMELTKEAYETNYSEVYLLGGALDTYVEFYGKRNYTYWGTCYDGSDRREPRDHDYYIWY